MIEMKGIEDTEPTRIEVGEATSAPSKKRRLRWYLILVGLVMIVIGGSIGLYAGYLAGMELRRQAENDLIVMNAVQQFERGVVDLEAGRYLIARQRFEFVISLDPNFPGVKEKLTEAMIAAAIVHTPTPEPTPTLEPTPDLRGEEELLLQIQHNLQNEEWAHAITTIEKLRDKNLQFRPIDVDGMYYIALRFVGVENILNLGQLEVGIYNLTLAERFAPLDIEAVNFRNWARMYLSAASYWAVDWAEVVRRFADIYPALPNLRDASGMTATERFRIGSIRFGDQLMTQEKYCDAQIHYQNALALANDETASAALIQAIEYCQNPPNQEPVEEPIPPTETPALTPGVTETPSAETQTPTPTPTIGGGGG